MDASTNFPATSLIVCSRNRETLLIESVESILAGNVVPSELIIIDQSDAANTALVDRKNDGACEVRYIWPNKPGVSRARNLGASLSRNKILAFTDDDVLVAKEWFGALIDALVQSDTRCVVTGQVQPKSEREGGFQLSYFVDPNPIVYIQPGNRDVLPSGNMALYADVFHQVGGFDERIGPGTSYPAAEDNDLGLRFFRAGCTIRYVPEALIYHREWRPESEHTRLRWKYGLGRGAFYAKHFNDPSRYTIRRLYHDVNSHLRTSLQSMRHDKRKFKGDLALAAGILYGAVRWLTNSKS